MHVVTPLLRSPALEKRAGGEVWLKFESSQPVGSFKIRGIGHACREYARRGARAFVSSSGGNAGLAVSYAGRLLGLPVTVIVPETTTQRAKDLISEQGATVQVHGANWNDAHRLAIELSGPDRPLIHPYDDPLIWDGHASIVDEMAEQLAGSPAAPSVHAPDLVVLSVGGGGLFCGVQLGIERHGWSGTRILAVETDGAASFDTARRAGRWVDIDAIRSVATSLGARQVARQAFEYGRQPNVESLTVSDAEAVRACAAFLEDHCTLVEPACGATLAPLYAGHPAVRGHARIVAIVCGGVGVTRRQLEDWERTVR